MQSFKEYLNEAKQTRDQEFLLASIGGGVKPAKISLDATRNPEMVGKVELEFFSVMYLLIQ